jgi:hypothetical protein
MQTNKEIIVELEKLYDKYQEEVDQLREKGILMENTAKTYLLHSYNFIRWCKEDFTPGGRNY